MIDEKKLLERTGSLIVRYFENDARPFVALEDVYDFIVGEPQADKWIPCSERLPSENGWYLVTNSLGVVQQQYWGANHWNKLRDECVIAWTNLPQPYKKEGAE